MMGQARRRVRRVSVMGKARRRAVQQAPVVCNVNFSVNDAHISSIIDVNKLLNITKIFKRKVSIKTRTNEAELNKQELEQKPVTEDLDLSIATCKKICIKDVQSTIVDERRYQRTILC